MWDDLMDDYSIGREDGKRALAKMMKDCSEMPEVPANVDPAEWIHGYFDYIERYFANDWQMLRKLTLRKNIS